MRYCGNSRVQHFAAILVKTNSTEPQIKPVYKLVDVYIMIRRDIKARLTATVRFTNRV
jgi:hypothetical protein